MADWLEIYNCNSNSNNHSLQPRYAEYLSERTTRRTLKQNGYSSQKTTPGFRSCQSRTGNIVYNLHRLTKIGQIEDWKNMPGLMSLDFCCNIQMGGSEFGIKNMKAWIHPALSQ